jgi:hypothetical protein
LKIQNVKLAISNGEDKGDTGSNFEMLIAN